MDDEGVVDVQLLRRELVLLRPLVLNVVTKTPGEPDLGRVVNIAPNLQLNIECIYLDNQYITLFITNQNANKPAELLFSFIHGQN